MSIAAANLFTRNIYKEYFRPTCPEREETRVAKTVSLVIKLGALAFILLLPATDAINFQLLGGIWIIQTLPPVFLGLYTNWFHRHALAIGLIAGLIVGTWLVVIQNFVSSVYTISIAGLHIPAYAAVSALVVNLFCCTAFTLLFRMLGISAGRDATRPADFEANPVPGSRSAALEAQIGRTAHAGDTTTKTQESAINRSR
jgi:SSS family solute:Na+ symporter